MADFALDTDSLGVEAVDASKEHIGIGVGEGSDIGIQTDIRRGTHRACISVLVVGTVQGRPTPTEASGGDVVVALVTEATLEGLTRLTQAPFWQPSLAWQRDAT